jgi:exodeoxyribonuclease VII large subunit
VLAKTNANIWDSGVIPAFLFETKLQIHEIAKQQILFHGRYNYHPVYGFALVIDEISPTYTVGKLQQAKGDILEALRVEGVAEKNMCVSAPSLPLRLAVISGAQAAGYEDFIAILDDAGVRYEVELFAATVHGNNAKQDVYGALQEIYRRVSVSVSGRDELA